MTNILDVKLDRNDAGAGTVRGYLKALLREVWDQEECFSGKRPFGNSGWKYDLYGPLIKAGVVSGTLDQDGYVETCNDSEVDEVIANAIDALMEPPQHQDTDT